MHRSYAAEKFNNLHREREPELRSQPLARGTAGHVAAIGETDH
jgi:hypothetical protein